MVMTPTPVGVNPWQRFKGRANNKGLEQDKMADTEIPTSRQDITETLENIITAIVDEDGVSYEEAMQRLQDCLAQLS